MEMEKIIRYEGSITETSSTIEKVAKNEMFTNEELKTSAYNNTNRCFPISILSSKSNISTISLEPTPN